jgi:ribokinase
MARGASPPPSVSEQHEPGEGATTGRVIVVGSVNIDLVVTVERLPAPGETVTGGRFARHHGGKGGNQAVAAARLGARVAFVGAVGGDAFGDEARAALEAEGIDTRELRTLTAQATGVAIIIVATGGENVIAASSGANASVTAGSVREAVERLAPTTGDIVLVGHEIPTAAAREALLAAAARGATTVFNPAPADSLDRATMGLASVITPNRHELASLVAADARRAGGYRAPADTVAAARALIEPSAEGEGPAAILVSLGGAGALVVRRGADPLEIRAPQTAVVDTVGAGDALNGALAAALAGGRNLEDAAREAVVAASLSTVRAGAREGMPTRADLDAALRR